MLAGVSDPDGVHDNETNMTIPTDLVTVERRNESTNDYDVIFMTRHIADIVADVQQEKGWPKNWEVLNMYFRNPETRGAVGKLFRKMFLGKLQNDPSKMPPCFEMGVA